MNPFRKRAGAVLRINGHLLLSFACGYIAWAIWPQNAEWWGLGVISIIVGMAAPIEFVKALKAMATLHARDRVLTDYEAQGGRPKSSKMATAVDLRRAGMLDE